MKTPRELLSWIYSESLTIIAKEILKWVVVTGAALVGGWLYVAAVRLFDDDQPLASAPFWHRLSDLLAELKSHPIDYSLKLFGTYPASAILALILAASYAVLFLLLRQARRKLREASIERSLAIQAGIGGRWPHAKTDGKGGAPWGDLCSEIARHDNGVLLIIGANGLETFGRPESPLYNAMQNFRGSVRVILTDPDSGQTAGRAAAVGMGLTEYKRAIGSSVRRLRDLRRQQHAIEGRYYDGQPNWKMIITSRTLWVQYYIPGGMHVDQTPVWRFDSTEHGNGLYHLFTMEFDRIWLRCAASPMDLT